jgi:hypothetical protein
MSEEKPAGVLKVGRTLKYISVEVHVTGKESKRVFAKESSSALIVVSGAIIRFLRFFEACGGVAATMTDTTCCMKLTLNPHTQNRRVRHPERS